MPTARLVLLLLVIPLPLVTGADGDTTGDADSHSPGRPFIGVSMEPASGEGAAITGVFPGTAAERFGLEAGDVILGIDEISIPTPNALVRAVESRRPGDEIAIELLRAGERRTIRLELGTRPGELELRRDRADHVIEVLRLRPGMTVADIGCGSGWLAEAVAAELDGNGPVYAVELREDLLDELKGRELPGVVPVLSTPGDVSLPDGSLDIAVLHDVASHVNPDAREGFYASIRRALRPAGRLVVFGPHGKAEQMLEVLGAHGFVPSDEQALADLDAEELDRRLEEGITFRPSPTSPS